MSAGNIPITGTITTTNEADTYPTHWDKYAKGGFRSVANIQARDAISLERRTIGMQIFINDTKQLQQLVGGTDNTKWVTLLSLDENNKIVIDLDSSDIALSEGRLLVGDSTNRAAETQTLKIENLPTGDLTNGGVLKFDAASQLLKIAVPDIDYATKDQLDKIAADASKSADAAAKSAKDSDTSAVESSRYATTSSGFAAESSGAAGLALGYAQEAGESVTKCYAVLTLCTAEVAKCVDYVADASDYADTAKAASKVAGERRDEALNSANAALTYYNNIKATGLNALPNSGDVDFKAYRAINLADGIDPQDAATVAQITAASTGVQSVLGEPGQTVSSGGQNPVISISPELGINNLPNFADINAQGFAIINAAPGGALTDLATVGQVNSMGNSAVKSVSGTAGQINSTGGQNPIISISPQLGLNNLPNFANIDFKSYKGINAADGVSAGDLVTVNQLNNNLAGYVKSVNGTGGQINVTPGQNPVVSIANTAVTPAFYRLANVTTGADGRLTFASSTTVSGNTGRISVFNAATNVNIDLDKTTVTPGTYALANPTFDAYGRATAATSTAINGNSGRVVVSGAGTTTMNIDLAKVGNVYAPAIGQYRRTDEYGRMVHNEECYFNTMTTGGQTANTTITGINILQPANLAVPTTNEGTNMFTYNGGTTGIKINTQYPTKKVVSQEISIYTNLSNEAMQVALIKNYGLSGAKMFAHRQLYSLVSGQPYSITITGLVDLVGGDTVHLVYACGVVGRVITTTSHSWLLY